MRTARAGAGHARRCRRRIARVPADGQQRAEQPGAGRAGDARARARARSSGWASDPTGPPGRCAANAPTPSVCRWSPCRLAGFGNLLDPFLVALAASSQAADAHLITFVAGDDGDVLATYEHLLDTQVVDGFVLTHTRHDDPRAGWLRDRGVPFVSFGRIWDEPTITSWVDVDGYAGTVAAVEHVRDAGATAGSPSSGGPPALRSATTAAPDGWRPPADLGQDPARLSATTPQDALARPPRPPSGCSTASSRVTPSSASPTSSPSASAWPLGRRGLRPGPDIGVIGFDDIDLA